MGNLKNTMRAQRLSILVAGVLLLAAAPALAQMSFNPGAVNTEGFAPTGGGPLFQAVLNDNAGLLRQLLADGSSPNDFNAYGLSATALAARDGKCDLLDILIKAGARLDAKDTNGNTALILASDRGNGACVDELIAAHVDLNVTDRQGATALIHAAANGKLDAVKKLLAAKADPTITDFTGRTALAIADTNRQRLVVNAFHAAGINN
jgi:ankyrin repeat protein